VLDGAVRRLIGSPLDAAGRWLARHGATADGLTVAGFLFGLAAAAAIASGATLLALLPLALSRLLDGLDGAVARATRKTDRGGYLDITLDFAFYGAVPLAFALRDQADALAAAVLLFSFYVNGASFLAFSALAARRGMETTARGEKTIYFTAGLAEGTETLAAFVAMCVWPAAFAPIAWTFAGLCLVTAASRVALAVRTFD
jgi:phosphatidylglycerophosphate synthase